MRALALLMFVTATLPMAFIMPIIGLLLWIVFSYMNPHRMAFGFAVGFPWVMIIAVFTLFSTTMHAEQRQPLKMTPTMVLMTLFLAWTGIATLFAVQGAMAQAEWMRFFKILIMAYATAILVTDRERLRWVLWTIVLSFGFWGFKGGVFTLLSGGSYHVFGPSRSFFADNNDFALVMCMTLPLMRYLQLQEPRPWLARALWLLMGLTVVSIVGTYSRGGFLALGTVGLVLMFKSRYRFGLIVAAMAMVVGLYAFMPAKYTHRIASISSYQQDKSAEGRIESWEFATNVALARPLTGGGFRVWASNSMWNRYGPPGARHRAIHSIFFQVLGGQGFVGLGLYLALLVVTWRSLTRIRKKVRDHPDLHWMGDLASMMQVSLVGFISAGAFLPMSYFDLFYQFVAIGMVLQVLLAREVAKLASQPSGAQTPEVQKPAVANPRHRTTSIAGRRQNPGRRGVQDLPRW